MGKGKQAIRDIPQSMTVMTEKLMDDRNLDDFRDILRTTAGVTLPPTLAASPALDRWVRFNAGGTVTVLSGKVELGQGIETAIAQIAADELDVALERVELIAGETCRDA